MQDLLRCLLVYKRSGSMITGDYTDSSATGYEIMVFLTSVTKHRSVQVFLVDNLYVLSSLVETFVKL